LLAEGAVAVRRPASPTAQRAPLTPREIDVLRAISRGASNKEAARELALSPSTVRTHVESVFRKFECSTRAAATLKASAMGVLLRPSRCILVEIAARCRVRFQPRVAASAN
ncbi:response regulator transcription factor, partial [Paraburkholderia sp. BR14261]